jgi:hypothetical protein
MSSNFSTNQPRQIQYFYDRLGIAATSLCVVHCLTMPVLIPLSVAWGLPLLTAPSTERFILIGTLVFACVTLLRSCRLNHHQISPLLLASLGGIFYTFKGAAGETWEPAMVAFGGVAIVVAHGWNLRLCRNCKNDDG